jgi:predicted DNA binding CopG/RHH family protein
MPGAQYPHHHSKQEGNTKISWRKIMKTKLTKEEKEILDSFEKDEWVPVTNLTIRKKELMTYARNTLRKDKRLNIRISERDLLELQKRAVIEGLPYQTYVSSIIHKFINGNLVEVRK